MTKVSQKFKDTIKLDTRPQYQLAIKVGLNPAILNHLIIGYTNPKPRDERIIRVGRLVGLKPGECFDEL